MPRKDWQGFKKKKDLLFGLSGITGMGREICPGAQGSTYGF
jgi:hypothetical protein